MTDIPQRLGEEFLRELGELTRKYQLKITGCGCCSSPRLEVLSPGESSPAHKYEVRDDWGGPTKEFINLTWGTLLTGIASSETVKDPELENAAPGFKFLIGDQTHQERPTEEGRGAPHEGET